MLPLARIIDANANRAREALRTMEDLARFALDDAELARSLKELRHDLRSAIDALAPGIDRGSLLASRDTPGDVGTAISTPAEAQRSGFPDIAAAAAGRLTEALRVLEEMAKAAEAPAQPFEGLRYRVYEAERQLALALGPRTCPQFRLCILITESLCDHHSWEDVARAGLRAGADALQLREKNLDGRELLSRARKLVEIAGELAPPADAPGTPRAAIIINDRPDIALLAGASGLHLGQTDLPLAEARKLLGFRLHIGLSTTNLEQARTAIQVGADYCGLGPMFPTTTKHKPEISGPAYLRAYLADPLLSQTPHLAIGGITPENIDELRAAGCLGIAVSSAVCSARDPEAACRALLV